MTRIWKINICARSQVCCLFLLLPQSLLVSQFTNVNQRFPGDKIGTEQGFQTSRFACKQLCNAEWNSCTQWLIHYISLLHNLSSHCTDLTEIKVCYNFPLQWVDTNTLPTKCFEQQAKAIIHLRKWTATVTLCHALVSLISYKTRGREAFWQEMSIFKPCSF